MSQTFSELWRTRARSPISVFFIATLAISSIASVAAQTVPEPPGLWQGKMHGATPATLRGATVVEAGQLAGLLTQKPVLIDVANLEHKPAGRPDDRPWSPIHRSAPGTTWLPGAGGGTADPKFAAAFAAKIDAATGGDKDRPIVAFCHPQRWGSWNVAKRLTLLGYRHVYWFPGGTEGFADQGEATPVSEDPQWKAMGFDKDSSLPEAPPDSVKR